MIARKTAAYEDRRPRDREPEREQEGRPRAEETANGSRRRQPCERMLQDRHDRDVVGHGWNQEGFRYESRMNGPRIPETSDDFPESAPGWRSQ